MLAQQKIEQIRALPYESVSYASLRDTGVVDASPTQAPFSFTQVDNLAAQLPQGSGTITISQPATDLRRVDVTVSWGGTVQGNNQVTVSTLIANMENRVL
jgi:hypothetical protein